MNLLSALLAQLPDVSLINPCPTDLSCASSLDAYTRSVILPAIYIALGGVIFLFIFITGFTFVFRSEDSEAHTQLKSFFGHAIFGTILILFASAFSLSFTTGGGVEPEGVASAIDIVTTILKALVSAVLVLNIFVQGVRIIVAQEDGQRDKAKKQMIFGMVAAAIVILAGPIVDTVWFADIGIASVQAIGIANFLGTIFGALSVIGIVLSGIMLIISVDEGLKDRAKKLIIASMVSLAVVVASYALVTLFVFPS